MYKAENWTNSKPKKFKSKKIKSNKIQIWTNFLFEQISYLNELGFEQNFEISTKFKIEQIQKPNNLK
jgi:hypothetical protein